MTNNFRNVGAARHVLYGFPMRNAIIAAVLLSSSVAAAQAPGQTTSYAADEELTAARSLRMETVSYRKQVLIVDGLSVAAIVIGPLLAAGDTDAGGSLSLIGLAGYVVGAPIVHLSHGRVGAAAASFGLRTALPIAGMMAGFKLGPNDLACSGSSPAEDGGHGDGGGCSGSITGAMGGLLLGTIAAVTIDAKYLSNYERVATTQPTWSASVQNVKGGGMTFGVNGSF